MTRVSATSNDDDELSISLPHATNTIRVPVNKLWELRTMTARRQKTRKPTVEASKNVAKHIGSDKIHQRRLVVTFVAVNKAQVRRHSLRVIGIDSYNLWVIVVKTYSPRLHSTCRMYARVITFVAKSWDIPKRKINS